MEGAWGHTHCPLTSTHAHYPQTHINPTPRQNQVRDILFTLFSCTFKSLFSKNDLLDLGRWVSEQCLRNDTQSWSHTHIHTHACTHTLTLTLTLTHVHVCTHRHSGVVVAWSWGEGRGSTDLLPSERGFTKAQWARCRGLFGGILSIADNTALRPGNLLRNCPPIPFPQLKTTKGYALRCFWTFQTTALLLGCERQTSVVRTSQGCCLSDQAEVMGEDLPLCLSVGSAWGPSKQTSPQAVNHWNEACTSERAPSVSSDGDICSHLTCFERNLQESGNTRLEANNEEKSNASHFWVKSLKPALPGPPDVSSHFTSSLRFYLCCTHANFFSSTNGPTDVFRWARGRMCWQ